MPSPRRNWLAEQGGPPAYIERIAQHLRVERGMEYGRALATAVNTAKKLCADPNDQSFWPGVQKVNLGSRAEACAAVAEWNAKRAAAKAASGGREPAPEAELLPEPEPFVEIPWDPSPERFTDEQWTRACVLDRGPEVANVRERYALPIREPDGTFNRNAVRAAPSLLARIVGVSAAVIAAAARALVFAFRLLREPVPESLVRLAARDERRELMQTTERPTAGVVEQRSAPAEAPPLRVEGNRLCGLIPFGVESRDLGGWKERLEPGCLAQAVKDDLVATLGHDVNRILGRFPTTLTTEDRDDGMAWEVELPNGPTGQDVREAVRRGDLRATSWRMVVGRDRWEGDLRVVEEIRELRDVAVVANPAYETTAELRSQPEHEPAETREEEHTMEIEDRTEGGGGLAVEDRSVAPETPDIETRVIEAFSSVRKGESRSLTTTTADAITPPELATYLFDRLRARSVALASGIRVIATERETVTWPQIVSDPTPDWYGETELIVASDPVFASLTATPKKLAVRTEFSNEVLDDSVPDAGEVVRRLMLRALAEKLDLGIFEGNPAANADSIRGLKYTAGVVEIVHGGANGGQITNLDVIADAIALLEAANVEAGAIVMHPRTWATIRKLKDAQQRPLIGDFAEDARPRLFGLPVYTTTALAVNETTGTSNDTSSIYVYATDETGPVLVRRKDAEVELDRSRLFNVDMSEMRGKLRAALLVPQPTAVVRVRGVRP